jgi:hypothetical protein
MADYDPTSGFSQVEHAMRVLHLGGDLGMDRRIMFYPACLVNGYTDKCLPSTGVGGARRPKMDAPAHMFVDSAKVSFSTAATSLWQREAATIEKSLEGNTGTLSLSPSGQVTVGSMRRSLLTSPTHSGWRHLSSLSEWVQGMVGMADEMRKVDSDLQHSFSPRYGLASLIDQHRVHMTTVYDEYFRSVRAPQKAFQHFVAMEEAVRRKLSQLRPTSWEKSVDQPQVMQLVKAYSLRAERELIEDQVSGSGRPNAGAGVPTTPVQPKGNQPRSPPGTDHRGTESFPSLAAMLDAYGAYRSTKGHAICCSYNFSSCAQATTPDASGVPACTGADGTRRLHLCVRCGKQHPLEGAGKCANPHLR